MTAELSIVIPVCNERDKIRSMLCVIDESCRTLRWEAIFVDDASTDGTAELIREFAREDERVRCLQRVGRKGFSSASLEGVLASSAPCSTVVDIDIHTNKTMLRKCIAAYLQPPKPQRLSA